ncbi:tetratricopeptide repeat protein [Candidatus Pacearchaeota archaeon]|nr:tetratricopeptide repeat protein [Candidatus Pacearchaeota archaeon]
MPSEQEITIPLPVLSQLCELIRKSIGLNFPEHRWGDLQRNVMMIGRDLEIGNPTSTALWLIAKACNKKREDLFIKYMTIGETFFFRDWEVWDLLKNTIIPERMSSKKASDKTLLFWSAACSTGEEPYSIAMTVDYLPALVGWDVTILATDINKHSITKAKNGVFSRWSFRNTKPSQLPRFFKKQGKNYYAISQEIKDKVIFNQLNLTTDTYPSTTNRTIGVDVIFCRNVLMYFPEEVREKVISRLCRALNRDGWLILAASENSIIHHKGLSCERMDNVFIFRKRNNSKPSAVQYKTLDPSSQTPKKPLSDEQAKSGIVLPSQPLKTSSTEKNGENQVTTTKKIIHSPIKILKQAQQLFLTGKYEDAEKILKQLLSKNKKKLTGDMRADVLSLMAKIYANQGRLSDAREIGEKAIEENKLEPGYYYFLATVCQELGDDDEAVKLLKQSLYLEHNFILAYFQLANLVKNKAESRKYLTNTLSLLKNHPHEKIIPDSGGLTAGHLRQLAEKMLDVN